LYDIDDDAYASTPTTVRSGGGSDAIFTGGFKYVFGMYPRATRQFASAAALFKTLQPLPATYSVMYTNDAFSKNAAEGVKLSSAASTASARWSSVPACPPRSPPR
jgi:hypothetical protein